MDEDLLVQAKKIRDRFKMIKVENKIKLVYLKWVLNRCFRMHDAYIHSTTNMYTKLVKIILIKFKENVTKKLTVL